MIQDNYVLDADDQHQADLSGIERAAIFNLNPIPAVIYDRKTDRILSVNSAFVQLTNYSNKQVQDKSLALILPDTIDKNPIPDKSRIAILSSNNGLDQQVYLSIVGLDLTNKVVALLMQPIQPSLDIKAELIAQENFFDKFDQIIRIANYSDLEQTLRYVELLTKNLTSAELVGIYLSNEMEGALYRVSVDGADNDFLPDSLIIQQTQNDQDLTIWKDTKKAVSALQELAQQNEYKYLVTIPLSIQDKNSGMIILAGHQPIPNDETLRLLKLLGSETAVVVEHFMAIEATKKKIQNLRQVIQIEQVTLDNMEEGAIILTPDLRIAEMNPAAEIVLGYAAKEVFRQSVDAILIGTESLTSAFNSALQGIPTLISSDLRLHNRTGKSFPAQIMTIPVKSDEKLISIVILVRDLSQTEQIRARTQQLEQRAFLGEVSAVFAHEVKNPINSLQTGLQYIGMNLDKDSPYLDLVNRLQNDCQRLTHLMDSVLTFSKPVEYHFSPVDLSLLIPRIVERWGPRMRRLNITSYFQTCTDHPLVTGDARALEQVFVNLISNAVQAMDVKGGSLSIRILEPSTATEKGQYEIIVADSGPGIPDDVKEHIFEPFITTNQNGTGLGLAISKRIITAHKGNIYVESYPGGTMFHVFLPKSSGEKS